MKEPSIAKRLLRLALYVAIGLAIAVVIGIAAVYLPDSFVKRMSGGWVGLIIYTPIVFWYAARQYKGLWRLPSFWLTLLGLLVLHVLAFTVVLRRYPLRPIWFMVLAGIEIVLILTVLDVVLPHSHNHTHRHDAA